MKFKQFYPFAIIFTLSLISVGFSQKSTTNEDLDLMIKDIEEYYDLSIENLEIAKGPDGFVIKEIHLEDGTSLDQEEIEEVSRSQLLAKTSPPGP